MSRPRLLDLFCGAGGAGMGYHRAGFDVVGVDIKPQPHYPFEFVQADALEYCAAHGREFDAIHASPPCQHYSTATRDANRHPDLYEKTIDLLRSIGVPLVVENVIGAPYRSGIILCGSMFGLRAGREWLRRHRNFETSCLILSPACRHPEIRPITVTGNSFVVETREYQHSRQTTFETAKHLMDIDWMTRNELAEAIPPAYTEYIGRYLMAAVLQVPR